MTSPSVDQPAANLHPSPTTALPAAAEHTSLPFTRPPSASFVTFMIVADAAGELAIDALRVGGSVATAADWLEVTTAAGTTGGRATVVADEPAFAYITGGPSTLRARYVATTTGSVSVMNGWYSGH